MSRVTRDWQALDGDQRLALGAAIGLFVTMLLPWYQQNAVVSAPRTTPLQSRNLNAFQVFSFIEAAVLVVAIAIVYLLYARAEGRDFRLPGSDGAVVFVAGLWTVALLVFRLFDKPGISTHGIAGNVGVQWGIFFALGAAGLLAYAGSRMRSARQPEAPLRRPRDPGRAPERDPGRGSERDPGRGSERDPEYGAEREGSPGPEQETTTLRRSRRSRSGTGQGFTGAGAPATPAAQSDPVAARARPRYPPAPAEQMSFEDAPHESG
jgi:hypothetical protein